MSLCLVLENGFIDTLFLKMIGRASDEQNMITPSCVLGIIVVRSPGRELPERFLLFVLSKVMFTLFVCVLSVFALHDSFVVSEQRCLLNTPSAFTYLKMDSNRRSCRREIQKFKIIGDKGHGSPLREHLNSWRPPGGCSVDISGCRPAIGGWAGREGPQELRLGCCPYHNMEISTL